MLSEHHASISGKHGEDYSKTPPFHPDAEYPEYPFAKSQRGDANPAYRAVREALAGLGLDREHFGAATWNPLGSIQLSLPPQQSTEVNHVASQLSVAVGAAAASF